MQPAVSRICWLAEVCGSVCVAGCRQGVMQVYRHMSGKSRAHGRFVDLRQAQRDADEDNQKTSTRV